MLSLLVLKFAIIIVCVASVILFIYNLHADNAALKRGDKEKAKKHRFLMILSGVVGLVASFFGLFYIFPLS